MTNIYIVSAYSGLTISTQIFTLHNKPSHISRTSSSKRAGERYVAVVLMNSWKNYLSTRVLYRCRADLCVSASYFIRDHYPTTCIYIHTYKHVKYIQSAPMRVCVYIIIICIFISQQNTARPFLERAPTSASIHRGNNTGP